MQLRPFTREVLLGKFDDTNWAFLADQTKQEELRAKGIQPEEIAQVCTTIINEALAGKPEDLTVTTHICRGNHASSCLFSGGYEPIAKELFATNYDGFSWNMTQIVQGLFTIKTLAK